MKTTLFATALAIAMLAPAVSAASLLSPEPTQVERWIVGFHTFPGHEAGDSYMGARVVDAVPELAFIVIETSNYALFQARANFDDNVRYIETDVSDHKLHFVPNDYYWNHASNWGVKRIGATVAWDKTLGSTSVKEGHIDSGINRGHEDHQDGRMLQGYDFRDNDNDPDDTKGCSYHGTHTAGTVGADINNGKGFAGLAEVSILPVKIFGKGFGGCGAATTSNIAKAIKYVGDQGAHISSNSWGGGSYSTAINDAITYSVGKGVLFVAAAGNDGPCTNCIGQPWEPQEKNVIIVTSLSDGDVFSDFSSEGWETDLIAPGDYIGQSTGGSSNSYHIMSGTSMACPHVAGVAALVKSVNPSMTASQIESRLKSTAENLGFSTDRQGAGLVRADLAVY